MTMSTETDSEDRVAEAVLTQIHELTNHLERRSGEIMYVFNIFLFFVYILNLNNEE